MLATWRSGRMWLHSFQNIHWFILQERQARSRQGVIGGLKLHVFFPVRALLRVLFVLFRTFGPYHQEKIERPWRISGTTNTEVSDTPISVFTFAWFLRRFIPSFFSTTEVRSCCNSRQIWTVWLIGFQDFAYYTRPYEKIYSVLWTEMSNRKIPR